MRTIRNSLVLITLACAPCACVFLNPLDDSAVEAIRVVDHPDPRTVVDYGHVYVETWIDEAELARAEQITVHQLKTQAMRQYGDTTLLYNVHVRPSDTHRTYIGHAMAARRLGS